MVGFEIRNGVGFDIEVANSRPVAVIIGEDDEPELGFFEGWVVLLPFVTILWGEVFTEM